MIIRLLEIVIKIDFYICRENLIVLKKVNVSILLDRVKFYVKFDKKNVLLSNTFKSMSFFNSKIYLKNNYNNY